MPGSGKENGSDDPVARAAGMFGARRIWSLTDAQAERLEKIFSEKGPVVVRFKAGSVEKWLGAAEYLDPSAGRKRKDSPPKTKL